MISELASQEKVIGVKQSRKAIREGRAKRVYLACDADPAITEPVAASCAEAGIPVETDYTLSQLGQACRISVGASVVAVRIRNGLNDNSSPVGVIRIYPDFSPMR